MKKQLTAVLLIFVLVLTMAGCSVANAVEKLDAVEDLMEVKLDAVEDQLEDGLREAVSPAPAAAPTLPAAVPTETIPAPAETVPVPAERADKLTEAQAQQIALDHLGFTADQVTRLHAKYEIDDRIPQFDVEFLQGDWEYEFEIHAENGQILSYDKDHKND